MTTIDPQSVEGSAPMDSGINWVPLDPEKIFMTQWVVYDHPHDFPNGAMARKWAILKDSKEPVPTNEVITAATVGAVNEYISQYLYMTFLPRQETDDPKIIGVWI